MADISEPFIGFQAAISEADKEPVTADLVGEINTVGEISIDREYIDTTSVSDISGYTRSTPLNRSIQEIPVTVFYNKTGYDRVRALIEENQFQGDSIVMCLTIFYPTRGNNRSNYRYTGFLSNFSENNVDVGDVQKFTFTFKPIGAPVKTTKKIEYSGTTASIEDITGP